MMMMMMMMMQSSLFTSWPDEDPAIQVCIGAPRLDLDHRVSPLRVGPVMTEKEARRADRSAPSRDQWRRA